MRQFPRIEMCPSAVKPNKPGCVISGTVNIDGQWWGRGRVNKWGAIESGEYLYFLIQGGVALCGEAHHVSSLLPAEAYSRGGRGEKKDGVSCGGRKVQGEWGQISTCCPNWSFSRLLTFWIFWRQHRDRNRHFSTVSLMMSLLCS